MIKNSEGGWIEDLTDIQNLFKRWYPNFYTTEVKVEEWIQTNNIFSEIEDIQKKQLNESV